MAFCPNCGASVEGRFCARCGSQVTAAGAASAGTYETGTANAGYTAGAQPATAGGLTQNVAGALCYVLGLFTGIIFLVLAPYNQNKFVRFHAFQSIFFHVAFIAVIIAETILGMVLPWTLSAILSMLSLVVALAFLAGWVLLLIKAYQGERWKLPVIGDLAEKQA